ncbi:MAG: PEGA domain-containing protein [Verrucomicrobia bacterium]|nr:PEGA domain-containing protein [Verrucomicrobiota bacterium]
MIRRIQLVLFLAVATAVLLPAASAQEQPSYAVEINAIVDQFEQIQASIEVAFRADSYINSLQALRYRLKRLDETFGSRAEARYASFALAHSIEDTYLSLIKKMQEGNGAPPAEAIQQVTSLNQGRIRALKSAVRAEATSGEAGWSALIEAYFGQQDYNRAVAMAEQAVQAYPNSTVLVGKLEEVRGRIDRIKTSLTEANRLIENKEYSSARTVLDEIASLAESDVSVQELRRTVEAGLAKIDEIRTKALEAEKGGDIKLAFRTWSDLLDVDPSNVEAQQKIADYKSKFRIVVRRVYRTCPTCKGTGDCSVCEGSKLCLVCNGYARCLSCKGRGYHASICTYCLCRDCQGTGRCAACGGDGLTYCPQCNGRGYFTTRESRSCSVCNGTGRMRFGNSPCTTCGGTGSISVNVDKPCPRCGGRKVERCSKCSGNGLCSTCNGRGRAESCPVCRGLGRVISECPYCKGTSICLTCDGKGTCRYCKGTGRCSVCAGKQVAVQELEEQLIEGEAAGTLVVLSDPAGAQLSIDGEEVGTTPYEPKAIAEGRHTVRLFKDGHAPVEVVVDADSDSLVEVNLTLVSDERYNLRVLAVNAQRHSVLFKHYSQRDDGTFMASLMVDGKNQWVRDGEFLLGYQAVRLDKIEREQYNPRLGGSGVIDVSKLVLVNRVGKQIELTLGAPVYVSDYMAKLYDKEYNATWSAREGSRLGGKQVQSIDAEQVVFIGDDGKELVLPVN